MGVEQLLDYVESISWIAALPDAEREQTRRQVESIISVGEMPSELATRVSIGLTRLS